VNHEGTTPNANPPGTVGEGYNPGDPEGFEIEPSEVEARSLPVFYPSPWSGWPSEWNTPAWDGSSKYNALLDVAWTCLDKNASVLSTLPVFRTRNGKVISPTSWMVNPDPTIYSSWEEFANQVFWDVQLGEAFIMEMSHFSDGYPMRFRVMPPWAFHVEFENGMRVYRIGGPSGPDVTEDILHIRYKSTTDNAHGVGPLEVAGGRMLTAGVLAKYIKEFAETGGVPLHTIETEEPLTPEEAADLQQQYMASRVQNNSAPPVFDNGGKLVDHKAVSPKDAAMLELGQFTESRIAVLLGVPPFLVGLPSGGDSMTYSNVSTLFDFHDRQKLRSLAVKVMSALSYWALPLGQRVEINRDEYSRPPFDQRAKAWGEFVAMGAVTSEAVALYERFQGEAPGLPDETEPMDAITGGEQ
jgi:HK97 family phage portal protein